MDDRRLERIEKKLDDQNEHLVSIDKTLIGQHEQLVIHIQGTKDLQKEIVPLRRHVYMMQGGAALLAIMATIAGILSLLGILK